MLNLDKNIFKSIKAVGQVDTKYILGYINKLKEGINKTFIMIDQHAAHERIRFEWFNENLKSKNNECLILNPAIIIKHNIAENDIQNTQSFNKMMKGYGFTLKIENNTIILYEIPIFLYSIIDKLDSTTKSNVLNGQIQNLTFHLLEDIKNFIMNEDGFNLSIIPSINEFSATFACKGAIKFGDKLSTEQCQHIIDQLSLVKFPFICAHGR
ncbi:hypothetical protein K502DRAFT_208037 [Neoconidiobolus thromboides FSU 785]|nr:hypothetical protein K502DRAFT_208037 [Neoconidiobolus thromboides FSU 785]